MEVVSFCFSLILMPEISNWNISDDSNNSEIFAISSPSDSYKKEISFENTSKSDNKESFFSSESNNIYKNGEKKEFKEINVFEKADEDKKKEEYYENIYK